MRLDPQRGMPTTKIGAADVLSRAADVLPRAAVVLPRRAAALERQAGNVTVKLWGSVPHFGPMKFPVDSEFADISFTQGTHETGRNRVELVLQTRDPAIDSDLAWSDAGTVSTAVIGATDDSSGGVVVNPGGIFAQPVTPIGVDCLMTAPFCATNRVGIVSLLLQRFPFAARAEYLPSGSVSWKLPTGASGTVLNVLLVMPALLMNVSPCRSSVIP